MASPPIPQTTIIHLGIVEFALPVPRQGSIEALSGYNVLPTGQELHTAVQKSVKANNTGYRSEIKVAHTISQEEFTFHISGRIDGIYQGTPPVIEEIKTAIDVRLLKKKLEETPEHPYLLQARTYGYIYRLKHGCAPQIRMRLVSTVDPSEQIHLPVEYDEAAYNGWLQKRLSELVAEWRVRRQETELRKKLSSEISFPYEAARSGQEDLMDFVAQHVQSGNPAMLQAPTGLGKTAAVLLPSLKEALSRGQKLVYLTPKNSQHSVAESVVHRLQTRGAPLRLLTLTAKAKLCLKPEQICSPDYCEFARDYYRKVDENCLVDRVAQTACQTSDLFTRIGKEYEVCPFELSVDSLDRTDIVVGDYNYVFSPKSLVSRLSGDDAIFGEKPNLIVDEAHNLPARATDYYSPSISTDSLSEARKRCGGLPADLSIRGQSLFSSALHYLRQLASGTTASHRRVSLDPEPFRKLDASLRAFATELIAARLTIPNDPAVAACQSWAQFTDLIARDQRRLATLMRKADQSVSLKVICCDPAPDLTEAYKHFKSVTLFSATMKPFDYYARLCGLDLDRLSYAEFPSPFRREKRKLMIVPQISTRYKDRDNNYAKVAEVITRVSAVKPGNYLVFFPSFEFLHETFRRLKPHGFAILSQHQQMSRKDIEDVLDRLRSGKPTLLLAVQGGVFSEGVDFPGDMIIGAFIVGPALPHFDQERETVRQYFDERGDQGFDYVYTYPAMTRAVQAAGRVIRSETDRGLIVLMDKRFLLDRYAQCMPAGWFDGSPHELVSSQILHDVGTFWSSQATQSEQ